MTRKVVVKKNSTFSFKKTKDIKLSIQFSLGGFSFCILDTNANKTLFFSSYTFDKIVNSPEELLEKIKIIFKEDNNLQLDFKEIEVIHTNNLSNIIPAAYFNEKLLSNYLNFTIKTLKTDYITFDELESISAKNVYIPYVNINNFIFQNFGEFEYKHHKTILIEKLLKLNTETNKVMFVNVAKTNFDVVVLEKNKLIFSNSFNFYSKEDFIYYLLFTAEQLEMDPTEFKLFFTGAIEKESEIFKISYTYIKHIHFLESKNPIFNSLAQAKHTNFILLG